MAGQLVVLLLGAVTIVALTALIGPMVFHRHLLQTDLPVDGEDLVHIERAYRDALAVSLGVGGTVSLLAATVVTWSWVRRLRHKLAVLGRAAELLSRGHYGTRVPALGAGAELDALAGALDDMAGRLDAVERNRRRLLTDLAHELRTPIATLVAHHEAIADGIIELEDALPVLEAQTGRLSRLAEDVDVVSRAEEGRLPVVRRATALAGLLELSIAEWQEAYASSAVTLHLELAPSAEAIDVEVDPQRLTQVLGNLLGNALRHTPRGGHVVVACSVEGEHVVITVSDDGEGFTAEDGAHLFERFYRADHSRSQESSGSGIGLTISRSLVEAHGGSLDAASEGPGRGAVLTIRVPRGSARG